MNRGGGILPPRIPETDHPDSGTEKVAFKRNARSTGAGRDACPFFIRTVQQENNGRIWIRVIFP
jgi:hypothetical protein